jgi:hypothetical protein
VKEGQTADTTTTNERYSIPPSLMELLLVENIYAENVSETICEENKIEIENGVVEDDTQTQDIEK